MQPCPGQFGSDLLKAAAGFPGAEHYLPRVIDFLAKSKFPTLRALAAATGIDLISFLALVVAGHLRVSDPNHVTPDTRIRLAEHLETGASAPLMRKLGAKL